MSCIRCDGCGAVVDMDFEEVFEHSGEQSYNSGVLCKECHYDDVDREENARSKSKDLKVDMEKERRVFGNDIHS